MQINILYNVLNNKWTSAKVNAQDKGALNYTIKARVEGAVRRGGIN